MRLIGRIISYPRHTTTARDYLPTRHPLHPYHIPAVHTLPTVQCSDTIQQPNPQPAHYHITYPTSTMAPHRHHHDEFEANQFLGKELKYFSQTGFDLDRVHIKVRSAPVQCARAHAV